MSTKKKIGILGASGYTGAELLRCLIRHPHVEIVLLTAVLLTVPAVVTPPPAVSLPSSKPAGCVSVSV